MAGRPPKSTKLKIITGNPGGRKLNENEPQPEGGIPDMPEWIGNFSLAVDNWNKESKILDDMGLMTHAEAGLLAMRSYLFSQLVQLAIDVKEEGRTYQVEKRDSNTGETWYEIKANPKVRQIDSLAKEYRICGGLLGLDASSRSKMSINSRGKSGNEWDDI